MNKSIKLLNFISLECHNSILYYQDNRSIYKKHSTKYILGRINGSYWLNEIIESFLINKMIILKDLIDIITSKKLTLLHISNDYNQGIYEQLEEIQRKINGRIN